MQQKKAPKEKLINVSTISGISTPLFELELDSNRFPAVTRDPQTTLTIDQSKIGQGRQDLASTQYNPN